jgi:hypothetical protein
MQGAEHGLQAESRRILREHHPLSVFKTPDIQALIDYQAITA